MSLIELKLELVRRGIQQAEVADRIGIDRTLVSRILNEARPMPEGFEEQFLTALDEIGAEKAAQVRADLHAEAERRAARLLGEEPVAV